ncbi:pyridoxamine 5'-phosphate oxidase family protein [Streptomyces sp. NBC_00038]|uniref:helix-turn-helix domain-containing protein n=1 Tax=Streptomyces sp. NBC_00038 TaxID=2903615 RepID=UPI002251A2D5|nr:pyridoxamine 5'-phosphate oxidase family protein [Streptomyces sp. NBC_00038]MCX5554655.1 pyridoxamine 5'-phosphate oxidase family protein [Streptomyces sp. NBC_00038]
MSEQTPQNSAGEPVRQPTELPGAAQGDVGRRIAQRRQELGLSREETAVRAGTAPGYVQYLEEQSTAAPGIAVLIRLADALETTVVALRGGDADLPPGVGRAARHPELVELSPAECGARLSTHGVGRLAVTTRTGPVIVPVNYSVVEGAIVFRTEAGTTPAEAAGTQVAFEVDHIDEALSQGWSVLVRGRARVVTDPDAVHRLADRAYSTPWAGGDRDMWVSIDPASITGRGITVR